MIANGFSLTRLLHWVLLGFAAYILLDFLTLAIRYIQYPFEIDYGEGCSLVFLSQLKEHGTYFFDINHYPFSYAAYPPVFFLLAWILNRWVPSMLMDMRLLSTLATCAIVPLLYFLIYHRTRHKVLALIFSISFLSIWFVKLWAPLARVDMLACLFSLAGLFVFQLNIRSRNRYWAFLFFFLAFFTKQSAFLAPLSIFFYTLIRKDQRPYLFSYLAFYLIPLLAGFLALDFYTRGEAFKHLVLYTAQRKFDLPIYLMVMKNFLLTLPVFLVLAFPFRFITQVRRGDNAIYAGYFILNLGYTVSVGFTGSNYNYLIEPALSILIFAAIVAHYWIRSENPGAKLQRKVIISLVLIQMVGACVLSDEVGAKGMFSRFTRGPQFAGEAWNEDTLKEWRTTVFGDVLCENLSLAVMSSRPIFFGCVPPAGEEGHWCPGQLVADCHQQRFSLIIAGIRMHRIPEIMKCLEQKYDLAAQLQDHWVYRPKGENADEEVRKP